MLAAWEEQQPLPKIGQEIWKTQQWPQDWKRSVFIPISKKGNSKECSNYRTIALILHISKAIPESSLKIRIWGPTSDLLNENLHLDAGRFRCTLRLEKLCFRPLLFGCYLLVVANEQDWILLNSEHLWSPEISASFICLYFLLTTPPSLKYKLFEHKYFLCTSPTY